ncbi:MAG: sodium-dependent transporter [Ruminococcaceae bacterium]|nr:sodium-dependent transporter [Oscillospiraceae bacterium]
MEKRSSFTGKIGFIMAAAGSAVGLGNIWRFPYLAAQYGGGMFLLVYLCLAVTFGFALMAAEIAIGRKTGLSAIEAFGKLNKKWTFLGYIAAIVPAIILPYYSVIGGWVAKYLWVFVSGSGNAAANSEYFETFIGAAQEPLAWFALFIGATALIVLFGVEKGIEKVSKIMMPVLVVLSVGIAVYAVCMEGAMEGVKYYFVPNFEHFSVKTVLAAMGQLFYSMSLAMGIMITYGSYMKKENSIESSVGHIEIFDTGIAFIAGLMIIPAIYAVGNPNTDLKTGPGLMFVILPKLFAQMPGGQIIGAAFFLMVLFAALTSSISLMETVVSVFMDKFRCGRKIACVLVLVLCAILGIPSSFGNGIWASVTIIGLTFLDFFDFISNSVLMPIVAFFTCIFVGYVIKPQSLVDEIETGNMKFKKRGLFTIVIKYFAPICIVAILASSVFDVIYKLITGSSWL